MTGNVLDLFRLEDRVAVVTGGARGIGMFYTEALAQAGAKVVAADIDAASVRDTAARLGEEHTGRVLGVELDVSSRKSIAAMVRQIDEVWGRLDILVNNAALFTALSVRETPWGIPDEEWDRVMAVNVRGIYACTEACVEVMHRGGWGRVINIASGLAFRGAPALIHYAASKGAVVNLTRSMAPALGSQGITVNAIAPGLTNSPTLLESRGGRPIRETSAIGQRIIDRAQIPEDLLGTLIYLASPASDFVTGQTLVCDGGNVLH